MLHLMIFRKGGNGAARTRGTFAKVLTGLRRPPAAGARLRVLAGDRVYFRLGLAEQRFTMLL